MIVDLLVLLVNIVLAALVAQHVAGPVMVWFTQKIPARYRFKRIDTEAFLAARPEAFISLHNEMLGLGFSAVGSSELSMSHSAMYFTLYTSEDLQLSGMLVNARAGSGSFTYAEFTQVYADDSVLSVFNSPILSVYPRSSHKLHCRFPGVHRLSELLDIIQSIREAMPNDYPRVGLPPGREFEKIEAFFDREAGELVDKGWLSAAETEGFRKLTFKGAVLMTWKSVWPWKKILDLRDRKLSMMILERSR